MQPEEIKLAIEQAVDATHVDVSFEGSHVKLNVVSSQFEGVMPVKRQQMVYACLQEAIASGAIHAVHMKTFTPSEWDSANA